MSEGEGKNRELHQDLCADAQERSPEVQIVLPERRMDELADWLVALTEAIDAVNAKLVAHGFLGGQHGYGGVWDDAVFSMHPFCWCESEDCPWCMGCDCPETALHLFVDGAEVTPREHSEFFDREVYQRLTDGRVRSYQEALRSKECEGPAWHARFMEAAKLANNRRSMRHDPECDYCRGLRFKEKGAEPGRAAPNFWHKGSGLKVWWYKYIGRDQEALGPEGVDLEAIFSECSASVAARPSGDAQVDDDASGRQLNPSNRPSKETGDG